MAQSWRCTVCTLHNEDLHLVCDACGAERPPAGAEAPKDPAEEQWLCSNCTFSNPAMFLTCGMCNTKRDGDQVEPPKAPAQEDAKPAAPAPPPPAPPAEASPPPPVADVKPAAAAPAREEAVVSVASGESSFEHSEMDADIVQHDQEALSQSYCFKCRSGNVLRKCSFPRETFTLQHLVDWVCAVHGIAEESLRLEYRDVENAWVLLDSEEALASAINCVKAGHGESVFTRASRQILSKDKSPILAPLPAPPAPPVPEADVMESAVMVSTSAPLTEFQNGESCFACGSDFGYVFTRRHHCRACLRSFCDDCAGEYYPMRGIATPVRHCESCAGPAETAQLAAEARAEELASLEVMIADAVAAEEFELAARLKADREELRKVCTIAEANNR